MSPQNPGTSLTCAPCVSSLTPNPLTSPNSPTPLTSLTPLIPASTLARSICRERPQFLKSLRESVSPPLSQSQLARDLRILQASVSQYEHGRSVPSERLAHDMLLLLLERCDYSKLSPEDLDIALLLRDYLQLRRTA